MGAGPGAKMTGMRSRYHTSSGIVLRRRARPNGDALVTLLSPGGKWTALARAGRNSAGTAGRLSLFNDVTVQHYRRQADDLPLITQATLNGMLPRLAEPRLYGLAHVLAELVDELTVAVHYGEPLYEYLTSGLRGLCLHPDAEAVTIVYAWRMLRVAGLAPRAHGCAHRDAGAAPASLDIPAGALGCGDCGVGMRLAPGTAAELAGILTGSVSAALERGLTDRQEHLRVLFRYLAHHVGRLKSLALLLAANAETGHSGQRDHQDSLAGTANA